MVILFNTFLYEPLYNGLILITSIIPGADIGIAVVLLTLIVKFALFPFSHKSTATQASMRTLEPKIKEIKDTYKDLQQQAQKTMELYKAHGISPFSGCLTMLIQLPIIIALYWVFLKGIKIDTTLISAANHLSGYIPTSLLNQDILYSFVQVPETINIKFLGLIDMTDKSIILAALAGISQYFQIKLSMPGDEKLTMQSTGSIKDDLARSLKVQMRYVLPAFVAIFAYTISAAVALYWSTSNIFMVAHELIVKKKTTSIQDETN